jgi:tetratricopeptide (TPR) repeat protein
MSRLKRLIEELKGRRVYRVAVVYAAVAFVVWQAGEIAVPGLNLPDWVLTLVILFTVLGFPVAIVLAWAFDITPEGVKRTESEGARPVAPGDAERAARLSQNSAYVSFLLGYAYARAGRRDDAQRVLAEMQELATQQFVPPDYLAIVHVGLGEIDEAIDWLNRAYEARTDWPVWLAVDPVSDPLHSVPRYRQLLRSVGLSELIE